MREIRYRQWDPIKLEYYYSGIHRSLGNLFLDAEQYGFKMEQFTGFYDKNGVPIYEGDILRACRGYSYMYVKGFVGAVFFRKLLADYGYGEFGGQLVQAKAEHSEIIGDINNNPELLK